MFAVGNVWKASWLDNLIDLFLCLALLVQKEQHRKYKYAKCGHDLWVGHPDLGGHSDTLFVIIYRLVCRTRLRILKTVDEEGCVNGNKQAGPAGTQVSKIEFKSTH